MKLTGNHDLADRGSGFREAQRGMTWQHTADLIDRLSGIRRWLVRAWNTCEDEKLRNTIHDAEGQIHRALELLKTERRLRETEPLD